MTIAPPPVEPPPGGIAAGGRRYCAVRDNVQGKGLTATLAAVVGVGHLVHARVHLQDFAAHSAVAPVGGLGRVKFTGEGAQVKGAGGSSTLMSIWLPAAHSVVTAVWLTSKLVRLFCSHVSQSNAVFLLTSSSVSWFPAQASNCRFGKKSMPCRLVNFCPLYPFMTRISVTAFRTSSLSMLWGAPFCYGVYCCRAFF